MVMICCSNDASLKLLELSKGISKSNCLKLLIFIIKIKMRKQIEAFFSKTVRFLTFWTILRDPAKALHTWASCSAEFTPAQSLYQLHLTSTLKTNLFQNHWANACPPHGYHFCGMGKPNVACQRADTVPLPNQSGWLQVGKTHSSAPCTAGREEGKAQRDTKLLCGNLKSVSELQLIGRQLDGQLHGIRDSASPPGTLSMRTLRFERKPSKKGLWIAGEFSCFFINATATVTLFN